MKRFPLFIACIVLLLLLIPSGAHADSGAGDHYINFNPYVRGFQFADLSVDPDGSNIFDVVPGYLSALDQDARRNIFDFPNGVNFHPRWPQVQVFWGGYRSESMPSDYVRATANRLCTLAASAYGIESNYMESSQALVKWEKSPDDDYFYLVYMNGYWYNLDGNHHDVRINNQQPSTWVRNVICYSTAPPEHTISIDKSSIAAGEFAQLSYNYHSDLVNSLSCTPIAVSPSYSSFVSPNMPQSLTCNDGTVLSPTKTDAYGSPQGGQYVCTHDTGPISNIPSQCKSNGMSKRCVAADRSGCTSFENVGWSYICQVPNNTSVPISPPNTTLNPITYTYSLACSNVNVSSPVVKTTSITVRPGTLPPPCAGQGNNCSVSNAICPIAVNSGTTQCDASGVPFCAASDGTPVTAPPDTSCPAPTATLSNDGPVTSGNSANLAWSCENSTSASIDQSIGSVWSGLYNALQSGTKPTGVLTADKKFALTCIGPGAPGSATASTTVSVTACTGPDCGTTDPGHSLSCSYFYDDTNHNSSIDIGEKVTYSASPRFLGTTAYTWNTSDSATNSIGSSVFSHTYTAKGGYDTTVSASGYKTGSCHVDVGGHTTSCGDSPSGKLTAAPTRVKQGSTTKLNWSDIVGVHDACTVVGAPACTISDPNAACNVTPNSGQCDSPAISTQTTFTLRCGTANLSSVTVDVIPNIKED